MTLTPSLFTATLAGAFAGTTMPLLWARLAADGTSLVIAFLLVVALPAHAFVVGFARDPAARRGGVDAALLKRVAAWLLAAVAATLVARAIRG